MNRMITEIHSLPDLIRENFDRFNQAINYIFDDYYCSSIERLYLTGCGDSHHAALTTEMAFEMLAGIPAEALTAMQYSRYANQFIPAGPPGANVLVGISVSGEVSRTIEAVYLATRAGSETVAITASPESRLAEAGARKVFTTLPSIFGENTTPTPGVRSYATNQLVLYLLAIRMGHARGRLNSQAASELRFELLETANMIEKTIVLNEKPVQEFAHQCVDADEYVFIGSGPNYGTALFSAAKVLEASGDSAVGQDLEEWSHLQYFARKRTTPTVVISWAERDLSRAVEVAEAAKAIGRRVVAVTPLKGKALSDIADFYLPVSEGLDEVFSPLVTSIPTELFAATRAELLGESYFRGFGGGRSQEGGGGISRIRTSDMLDEKNLE